MMNHRRIRNTFLILVAITVSTSCQKKYTCACDGYGGLKKVQRHKTRSESFESAKAWCQDYEEDSGWNLVCNLE